MQQPTISSFLVWENVSNLPFPEEVKIITKDYNWQDYLWSCRGLPMAMAKYVLSDGKILYLEELPDGKSNLTKEEFTGDITIAGYFIDDKKEVGFNYLLIFKVTIVKGLVTEILLEKTTTQSVEEYEKAFKKFDKDYKRKLKILNSFWYLWLYRPYAYVVRFLLLFLIVICSYCRVGLIWLGKFLTPL